MSKETAVDLWRRLRVTRPRIKRVVYLDSPTDVPDQIERQTLVVVGDRDFQKWAMLECPCGRGHRLAVSLQRGHRPSWRLTLSPAGPSLFPSIDSVAARRCHFWIRDGRVRWVHRLGGRRRRDQPTVLGDADGS
jgi:Family of unknown function (DUF6527)